VGCIVEWALAGALLVFIVAVLAVLKIRDGRGR